MCEGKALYILGADNKLRQFLARLATNNIFETVIILFISISSIMLALDNPLNDPNGTLSKFLITIDVIFTIIFALESLMKILAFGLIMNGESSYLKNSWNVMDFVIVTLSIISLSLTSVDGL